MYLSMKWMGCFGLMFLDIDKVIYMKGKILYKQLKVGITFIVKQPLSI